MTDKYKEDIKSLLPNRDINSTIDSDALRESAIDEEIAEKERTELRKKISSVKRSKLRHNFEIEQKKLLSDELDKAKSDGPVIVVKKGEVGMTGTTRSDVLKLMNKLNINLNMQLTKTDTQNLLATLLTCNEKQLKGLHDNPKVPIAIKIVIKRLQEDSKVGDMSAIERIWDRVFGKANMVVGLPNEVSDIGGIIPNTPVSRETYMVLREVYLGK